MSNVVHIDRYRPVTTITEERVVQMLNWSPPKHDPSPLKAIGTRSCRHSKHGTSSNAPG